MTVNFSFDLLDSLNKSYFQNRAKWSFESPAGDGVILRPMGNEICARIRTYIIPEKPFEFYVFINEQMTDEEIQTELREFKDLTDGYRYEVI